MICMHDDYLVICIWLMVLSVRIDVNVPMTRPNGDDVVVVEEMNSRHVELIGDVPIVIGWIVFLCVSYFSTYLGDIGLLQHVRCCGFLC